MEVRTRPLGFWLCLALAVPPCAHLLACVLVCKMGTVAPQGFHREALGGAQRGPLGVVQGAGPPPAAGTAEAAGLRLNAQTGPGLRPRGAEATSEEPPWAVGPLPAPSSGEGADSASREGRGPGQQGGGGGAGVRASPQRPQGEGCPGSQSLLTNA